VRELASRLGLEVIDYHTRLANHSEWFPDTVHPNTRGMAVLASIALETITHSRPSSEGIGLSVTRPTSNRAVIAWPASAATLVAQSATRMGGTNANWAVADAVPVSDGTTLRMTNTLTGTRFFRLWQP